MGALKTSEQGDVVAGASLKDPTADDRPVDSGAKIIIGPGPIAPLREPTPPPKPQPSPELPVVAKQGGLWLVILLYILSAGALAYVIYERFLRA